MFERITFDPQIMGGQACIRGMRMPVSVVVRLVATGATSDQIVSEYPFLQREDVSEALQYAAWLASERVLSVG